MWQIFQHNIPDDFVLATGNTYTVKEFVNKAFLYKGYKLHWKGKGINEIGYDQNGIPRVFIDEKFYRPCEVELLLGNPTKAISQLNWERKYKTIDDLIKSMFEEK